MGNVYRIEPGPLAGTVEAPASRDVLRRAILAAALGGGASYLEGRILLSREVRSLLDGLACLGAVWRKTETGLEIIGLRRGEDKGRWAEKFSSQSWRLRPASASAKTGALQEAGEKGAPFFGFASPVEAGEAAADPKGTEALGGGRMSPGYYLPAGQAGPLPEIHCDGAPALLPLLLPLALARRGGVRFFGRELKTAPLAVYQEIFKEQDITWHFAGEEEAGSFALPSLTVTGWLRPGSFTLPSGTNPLLLTGLLFILPLLKADSVLILEQPLLGGDELDLSIRMLGDFGADVSRCQDQRVAVPGRQRLQSRYYRVESSYGLAAYFLTAGALGQAVEVKGLLARSLQTARRILDLLETQGCRLIQGENGGIRFMPPTDFGSFPFIDCSQAPELLPLLALSAAAAPGERMISGPKHSFAAQSRLLEGCAAALQSLGAEVAWQGQGLLVRGGQGLTGGGEVDGKGMGRLALLVAIAASVCRQPVRLKGGEAAEAVWPGFWEEYRRLGGRVIQE